MTCQKCQTEMQPGKAIKQTFTGMHDFPGSYRIATVSPGGPGKLVDCLKCPECGYSVTGGANCAK